MQLSKDLFANNVVPLKNIFIFSTTFCQKDKYSDKQLSSLGCQLLQFQPKIGEIKFMFFLNILKLAFKIFSFIQQITYMINNINPHLATPYIIATKRGSSFDSNESNCKGRKGTAKNDIY